MDIANPIYDVVFKYLMKDNRIAKLMVSTITGLEIKTLELVVTEKSLLLENESLTVYRLGFAATIVTKQKKTKKILIEIQKAKFSHDIIRFRRYLGQEYSDKNNLGKKGKGNKTTITAIPLLTIYFLGYPLDKIESPVITVNREYSDTVTGKKISKRDDFIEALTHDSYVVQIPYLKQEYQNDLLALLSIFDQKTGVKGGHILKIDENTFPAKYREVIRRLQKAVAEPKVRELMDMEDEIIVDIQDKERAVKVARVAEKKAKAAEKKALAEKEKERAEKEKALEKIKELEALLAGKL